MVRPSRPVPVTCSWTGGLLAAMGRSESDFAPLPCFVGSWPCVGPLWGLPGPGLVCCVLPGRTAVADDVGGGGLLWAVVLALSAPSDSIGWSPLVRR